MPEMPSARPEARRERGGLEERFQSASPSTRYEYTDVYFETADVDVAVEHELLPVLPEQVNYEVVQATAPVVVYHDGSPERRAWTQNIVQLRCNTGNARVRLRLSIPSDIAGQREESVEHPGDPTETALPGDLEVVGNLHVTGNTQLDGTVAAEGAVDFDSTLDVAGQSTLRALLDLIGGQIKFPATAVPSADANTLDDYEEGTWTPQLEFGGATTGITYTARTGLYTKIGNAIVFGCYIELSSKGSATGAATITGLTVGSANLPSNNVMVHSAGGAAFQTPAFTIRTGTTFLVYSGAQTPMDDTHFGNTTFLYFSGVQI